MRHPTGIKHRASFVHLICAALAVIVSPAHAQTFSQPISEAVSHPKEPLNALPNPYRSVENWAHMPEGRTWGSSAGVAVDPSGTSIWVAERCGANSCAGSDLAPILHFDMSGRLIKAFGTGMFIFP